MIQGRGPCDDSETGLAGRFCDGRGTTDMILPSKGRPQFKLQAVATSRILNRSQAGELTHVHPPIRITLRSRVCFKQALLILEESVQRRFSVNKDHGSIPLDSNYYRHGRARAPLRLNSSSPTCEPPLTRGPRCECNGVPLGIGSLFRLQFIINIGLRLSRFNGQ